VVVVVVGGRGGGFGLFMTSGIQPYWEPRGWDWEVSWAGEREKGLDGTCGSQTSSHDLPAVPLHVFVKWTSEPCSAAGPG
jgi:hypothetical protein